MITVLFKPASPCFTGLPVSVESFHSLDHYSADGFFNLNLASGRALCFVDVFSDLDVIEGDLIAEIRHATPKP